MIERFFPSLDEAMQARSVGEFVVALRLRTVTIYVVTNTQLPITRSEIMSAPPKTELIATEWEWDRRQMAMLKFNRLSLSEQERAIAAVIQ